QSRPTPAERRAAPLPVLRVTLYDSVSAWLIAVVGALGFSVLCLSIVWAGFRPIHHQEAVPVELVEMPGGIEEGTVGETLRVDSPAELSPTPSPVETESDESQIEETLDNVMELSDQAAELSERQFEFDATSSGHRGSAAGNGRRALGLGSGQSGIPREQRWFVTYSGETTVDEYAKQLDFFKVELGALFRDGRLVYLSDVSQDKPKVRETRSGADEKRLYMLWTGGGRKQADLKLFQKAGVDAQSATIFQFYPPPIEQKLAQLERKYRNRPVDEIRRTYFDVRRPESGDGYEYYVSRQIAFK
ncbi:MAG TPA: hypothetical protein VHB77_12690, partial [Planctomycetaceae bacterium]|nr:hypothetical protein [Planctomycetaceae bacterium]